MSKIYVTPATMKAAISTAVETIGLDLAQRYPTFDHWSASHESNLDGQRCVSLVRNKRKYWRRPREQTLISVHQCFNRGERKIRYMIFMPEIKSIVDPTLQQLADELDATLECLT